MSKPPPSDKAAKTRRFSLVALPLALVGRVARPLTLTVAAAAIGVAVAAAGLFRAAEREITSVPPGVVALVNGQPVLEVDFVRDSEIMFGLPFAQITREQRAQALRSFINDELLVQRALALDLPEQDTNVRTALQDSVGALTRAQGLVDTPTDDQLRAYYAAHRDRYGTDGSMTMVDLLLRWGSYEYAAQTEAQAMADAAQAAYDLRSGAPRDYVMSHYGMINSGRVSGTEPDFSAKIKLGPKLYAVAAAMNDSTVSEPVSDTDGVHVMIMERRVQPVFQDFESVKNNVWSDYRAEQAARAKADNLVFLRRNAKIILAPGYSE